MMEMNVLSNAKRKVTAENRGPKKDINGNRVATFFLVLVLVVIAVMSLKESYISTELAFYNYVRPVLLPVLALATAAAVVLWIIRRQKKVDERKMVLSASLMTCISAELLLVVLLYPFLSTTRLLVSLLGCALLFFIYYLYPRFFFGYSVCTVLGALALSSFRMGGGLLGLILPVALAAAMLVLLAVMLFAPASRLGCALGADEDEKLPLIITAALLLAGVVVGFVMPSLIFYAVVLLAASFLVFAIVNTLRMI